MNENEIGEYMNTDRFLIVGLGNPGRKYKGNRHNIGYMIISRIAEQWGIRLGRIKHKALVGSGQLVEMRVILAKPQTFMNLSGNSVGPLANYYKIPLSNLLVIYDEIDLALGTLRLREKGGSGGHNGMKSIINILGNNFPRLRLGVGRPPGRMDPAAYVLHDFRENELPIVDEMIDQAISTIETYLTDGIELAMTRHNGLL